MHCLVHHITPPKLGWGQPLSPFPPTKSLTPPHYTHFLFLLPPSHQSAGLVACSCIVFCWGSALADGGVLDWPADSRFNQRPRVWGDVDGQFFSFLSPFSKMSFSVFGGGDQRASGEAERAPQNGAILLSKVVLKWNCRLLWNDTINWKYREKALLQYVQLCILWRGKFYIKYISKKIKWLTV